MIYKKTLKNICIYKNSLTFDMIKRVFQEHF